MNTSISSGTVNFIKWFSKNSTSIQNNVRLYKGVHYFMDRQTTKIGDTDKGIEDLWNVYVKEMLG